VREATDALADMRHDGQDKKYARARHGVLLSFAANSEITASGDNTQARRGKLCIMIGS
jgi:hypothetical protein